MSTSAAQPHAYGLDTSDMHSSQIPAQTPRVQRNRVKDIVAQFNQEAKKRETIQRHHSYDQSDYGGSSNGYVPLKSSPSPPHVNGNSRNSLNHRSKSELNLTAPPNGDGIVYAQVQVVNGNRNGDANKYKTTVHTVHHPSNGAQRHIVSSKLAKSTGSLNRMQFNEEEEEDDRVLNTLNHKSSANNHSYYRFDDPAPAPTPSDSYKNTLLIKGHNQHTHQKNITRKNRSYDDDVFESSFNKNGSHIIPLRSSNGYNSLTESSQPVLKTKNIEKWSEKEDLGPNRRKFTEHEKVHLVTMSNDTYGNDTRKKTPSPGLKVIKNGEFDEDEFGRLRRQHRDVTPSPVGNYSKKSSTMEDSVLQRSRTVTPDVTPLRAPSRSPVTGYYFGQPNNKSVTSRHYVTENVTSNEESHRHRNGRRHSTDSAGSGVLLSSRLVKQANAELNNDFPTQSPLPPLMTSSWRRDDEEEIFKNGRLRSLSPRLRPLSPSSGISSATSAGPGRTVGETREEKRHFRKQETTKTTKHETERSRPVPANRRSRSAERHHRLMLENNENNEPNTSGRRSASSTARRRLDKHSAFGNYYDEEKMETSGSDAQLYGGSQGSNMSLGSAQNEDHHHHQHHHHQKALHEKETIMAAHSNTPSSMMKQMNKNSISYENAQRRESNDAASASSGGGRRMWFERLNDDVDDVRLSSATMSRLETKKNRRNHVSDNELSVNTVDRRDVMRRRRNKDVRHADRSHGQQVGRSSSFNSRVDNYHSENENESQASSTASKPKRVNFKASKSNGNGYISSASPMHREAMLRSTSPARAPSIASNDSELSNRSVILHATAVADMPASAQYRARSANTSPAPSTSGSADGRSSSLSRGGRQKDSRTVQRSFSLLSPWKPRRYKEKASSASSYREEASAKTAASKKSQESLSHHSSSAERLDSLSPLPSDVPPKSSKKKTGILRRRHSMPKDSRFANFFRRKNKEAKKK